MTRALGNKSEGDTTEGQDTENLLYSLLVNLSVNSSNTE